MGTVATLYDHDGRKIKISELKEELIDPGVAWIRRGSYSVASSLTPSRLGMLLRQAADGNHDAYLTLAEEIEERELHYRSVLSTRRLAVSGAPVEVQAADDSAKAKEIADAVRQDLTENDAFVDLLFDLLDGLGKGFSVSEIIWNTEGKRWIPRAYKWRDPRLFHWNESLEELRVYDEADLYGKPLAPFKFVRFIPKLKSGVPIRGGLARVAVVAYMFKSYTVRDWHTFMDVFGMPIRLGRYGKDATEPEIQKLRQAVTNIAADAAGLIPDTMSIEFIEAAKTAGGDQLFRGSAEWWDKQISKVVLGQTMTSEDGSSLAQAKVHNDVRLDIAQADARQLCAAINRDLVRAYVDLNFGAQERYPSISLTIDEPEDLRATAEVIEILVKNGVPVPLWWVREKFGIPEAHDGEELLGAPKPPAIEPPPPPPGDEDEGDEEGNDALAELNRRITELEISLNRRARTVDQIDRWAAEAMEDWEPQLGGTVGRVMELARMSDDYEDFLSRIDAERETMDIDELTESLAAALFAARGLGDATDQVS